ncbi:MAG: TIGR02757 family protein [Chitinispirillaceae bacterium]|nr:TIGR02757 family protein [Chitinispirillaceae bacterium]
MRPETLKSFLEEQYRTYHRPEYLRMDPLCCLERTRPAADLEIASLLAAMLSYGRAETIISSVSDLLQRIGPQTVKFCSVTPLQEKIRRFAGFRHRFTTGTDIAAVLHAAGRLLRSHGSLEDLFIDGMDATETTVKNALDRFSIRLKQAARPFAHGRNIGFLLSSPSDGSACKRMNMFLRWMVRPADGIDFGIWKKVSPSLLVIPVDTHVARIARDLRLTKRRTADWTMAEEITARLRSLNPFDPVKYDFSLCRTGMAGFRRMAA